MEATKVPVSPRALLQRINRKLAPQDLVVKTLRSERHLPALGRCYMVHRRTNSVIETHIDPVALAKNLGVLAAWEAEEDALAQAEARVADNWRIVEWHDAHPDHAIWDGPGPLTEDARAASRAQAVARWEMSLRELEDRRRLFAH